MAGGGEVTSCSSTRELTAPPHALHLLGEAKQMQGVVGQLRLGDEGADAMSDDDVAAAGQVGERLPGRHAADAGALGQLTFGGKLGPGRQRAGADPLPDGRRELVVERDRTLPVRRQVGPIERRHAGSPRRSSTRSRNPAMCCSLVT